MHASKMHLMASDTNKQCKRSRQPEHAAHNAAGLVALLPAISSLPPPAASPDAALLLRNELLQLRRRPVMWVLLPSGHLTTRGQLLQTGRPACRNARPRSLSEVHDAAGASTCLDLALHLRGERSGQRRADGAKPPAARFLRLPWLAHQRGSSGRLAAQMRTCLVLSAREQYLEHIMRSTCGPPVAATGCCPGAQHVPGRCTQRYSCTDGSSAADGKPSVSQHPSCMQSRLPARAP